MYLTPRAALVRNAIVALANGGITLAILLIAPLGLAAVITNTALVAAATLVVATLGDGVVYFLQGGRIAADRLPDRPQGPGAGDRPSRYDLQRRNDRP